MSKLEKQEACQLFIEQEIETGLAEGKTKYLISKEIAGWIEKLFGAEVKHDTIERRAERYEKKLVEIGTNVPNLDIENLTESQKQIIELYKKRKRENKKIRAEINQADLEKAQAQITEELSASLESVCDIRTCSCAELFASGIKPDAVITDPPYPKEFLPVFTELAESCKAADVPLVAVMSGQSYLPEVMQRLCEFLAYRWTLAYITPGGQSVQQWPCKVNTFWKPVLLFGSSLDWIGDVCKSDVNDNDKRFHNWGQSESGMIDLVERLTKPGQLVCDPFGGAFTTGLVSLKLGRRFVGCDIDSGCVEKGLLRIKAAYAQS